MASLNSLLLGLLFSILLSVGSAHRLLSKPRALLATTTTNKPPTTSHHPAYAPSTAYAESHHPSYPPMRRQSHLHSRQPAYPPSTAYPESHHPSYPPVRRQNGGYALGTRPFPLTPPTPPPSPSTEPPTPPPTSAATGDNEWTWTYKARAPLNGINSGNDQTIPVIWPDLGGASQDPFETELNYVYEDPPPKENNN